MKKPSLSSHGIARVRALLDHAACPTAFPVVRTRFLGNIATPRLDASPVQTVTNLWGGQLPTFDTAAAANELFDALMGLWNALATHQSESTPFRLTRIATQAEPEDLRRLCQIRIDELEGFIDGLFGDEEAIELPERAHEALEHLREINAMLHGIVELLGRQPAPPASADDVAGTLRNVRELSRIAEQGVACGCPGLHASPPTPAGDERGDQADDSLSARRGRAGNVPSTGVDPGGWASGTPAHC